MITQQTIQQILSKIDILDVVGEFVKLKKRGTNYLGLCPFHNEKSPSFTVSPSKEIYKCFGCGRSGNTISFLMEHEKYAYVEALKWLAQRYNIEVEETTTSPEYKQQQQVAESLYILNQFAQKYFSQKLFESEEGTDIALSYLTERGFNEEIIRKFQIGYNPELRDDFAKTALASQYNPEILQKSGLVVFREEKPFDNYRGRIIFPIHNQSGKVLGFGARIIAKNDKAPKYINTPENEIYVKSRVLYGSYFARHAIDKMDECLLVEGYTDVVSLHQAGIENVVASGGTSLTIDQLRLIKKYTPNLTIIYDGDAAGVKAALRGLDLALEEGLNVKLVLIPDKEDPDSYVIKFGAAVFRDFIETNKKDVILFQIEASLQEVGNDSTKKAALVNQIAESISRINKLDDFSKQQDYIRSCSSIMKIDEEGLTNKVNQFIRDRLLKDEKKSQRDSYNQESKIEIDSNLDRDTIDLILKDEKHEKYAVGLLLEFGLKPWDETKTVAEHIFAEIEENELTELLDNKELLKIIEMYRTEFIAGKEPQARYFQNLQDQALSKLAISTIETTDDLSYRWKDFYDGPLPTRNDLYIKEVESSINYLKLRKIKRMIVENQIDMEKSSNPEELITYLHAHKHLKEIEIELTRQIGTVILK